ncbi:tRNA (32-2'-O)-methyltransferase regulator THADA-like isoform X2 [Syngnathoides biaculeatus]|uniref:tRNA (32-2'-O)-methyltransferase regulator THADA-like isoform X2 n=1 Tax=Syngnathoides biaculeatus TaxID=300417 RepID=UPI002ADDE47C|nr:tRNA (32-2'-O)-methyltransferase regulator THADA-like isoform X2 [Syngnathoides biaculeatus]
MLTFDELLTSLHICVVTENQTKENGNQTLQLFFDKLSECSRSDVKRRKERLLDEAAQLLKAVKVDGLEPEHLHVIVRLLVSLQLQTVHISTACRKVDRMLQQLAKVDRRLVFGETQVCLSSIVQSEQMFTQEDLQRACMFLEDSAAGRDVWRELCPSFLDKLAKFFLLILHQESLRDGPLCYLAVKMCLQIFQLLSSEVSFAVWDNDERTPAIQEILQALTEIIFRESSNRDTRLLAGTATAMLINTASERSAGAAAAWSLLQSSDSEPRLLTVGALQVRSYPTSLAGVGQLAMARGLLMCCHRHILLSSCAQGAEGSLLLDALFPLLSDLCEEKLNGHFLSFEVLTLWLKKVRECASDIWEMTGGRLLADGSNLQQRLCSVIWTGAESPVEGVSDCARVTFSLLLDLYDTDCERFGDQKKPLYLSLLQRIIQLPWESKAKYQRLCALVPYLGTDTVLDQYAEIPNHLLKCVSNDHLCPCGSELYRCLIQQQRRELCGECPKPVSESDLANQWAGRWLPVLLEALTSRVVILQSNSSTHLLPCTFQVFPSAVEPLLASLDPSSPGHLCAWAFIMSSYRVVTGGSPWSLRGSCSLEILQLALGSADDNVRLAALNLLCCSPKTKDTPTPEELSVMRTFIPQNLNSESSLFRQHFQAAVRRFLVRLRDGCLAHVKQQKNTGPMESSRQILDLGIGFVDWLSQLLCCSLTADHNYQRKKTALLLLSALLETCTDTWSPDKKKGQPPVNMGSLIDCARLRGQWDFFSRTKLLVLISCLEDSTNEIRELSAGLLVRFFPSVLPADVAAAVLTRAEQLLCSPRVQQAQMGALMMQLLHYKCQGLPEDCKLNHDASVSSVRSMETSSFLRFLVNELEDHYATAKAHVMLAARTKPIHGVVSALQKCLSEDARPICDSLGPALTTNLLSLLKNVSALLLGVLRGHRDLESDSPASFCDMGNAIKSLIGSGDGQEEGVLLSEEHSLVLTCCWVSLKETGILLGSLVERVLSESKPKTCVLTKKHLETASDIFRNILLKCRHWGAVEGCCVGFTRFCSALLRSSDPELRDVPSQMLQQALQVVQSPRCTSVTRRAAGLPMLILCVVSAEEASKARPLLAHSIRTLLDTARIPLPENWDQTLDLPQVCAVHTLQALVRGSGLGVAILRFSPDITILALTMLSSPCWAMRNAALQLYSSLCSRMLGQRPGSEGGTKHGMSPRAFFRHYSELQPFLLEELRETARDLQRLSEEARLRLQPSLYPILTLLSQLQPGVQDSEQSLADFLPPLLQLSASPIYGVRAMASKALVAMAPPSEYANILIHLTARLPGAPARCCHNWLHGQLLHTKALLDRALGKNRAPAAVVSAVEGAAWLATDAQRCPLVRATYVAVVQSLGKLCSEAFLSKLFDVLTRELRTPQQGLQIGLSSFHHQAIQFLCADPEWACGTLEGFAAASCDLKLALVAWVAEDHASLDARLKESVQSALQSSLREALLSPIEEYRRAHLAALVAVTARGDSPPPPCPLEESVLLECLDLLLRSLEDQKGGSEFLSQALCAASLLLSHCFQNSVIQRWCGVLESYRSPDVPEVLRIACAEALCVAGLPLVSQKLIPPSVMIKLLSTCLHLLQDQSRAARSRAAGFVGTLRHVRGGGHKHVYLMQVNLAVPFLLDLLLEECRDTPTTLEVLLSHVPHSDLRSVLTKPADSGCRGLYEQDDANVFAEPSVMCAHVLPYLLLVAEKCSESSALASCLGTWAQENAALLLDNLALCKDIRPAETPTLLTDARFLRTLCGLLARATFLLRLCKTCDRVQDFCDPSALRVTLKDVRRHLRQIGVHLSSSRESSETSDVTLPHRGLSVKR